MKHLSASEFVDLIESPLRVSAERVQHVEECAACRDQAGTIRAALALADDDRAPEPSPLFWDHFAARVGEAVRNESLGDSSAGRRWLPTRVMPWAAVGSLVVLVILTGVWRATLHAPASPPIAQPVGGLTLASAPAIDDDVDSDEAWAVVRDAARDLDWDDARAAGLSAHPGTLDEVAVQLSAAERLELARLLDEDLRKNGA